MKLYFHKITYEGRWFRDNETPGSSYTEKVPPNTGYEWGEEAAAWVLKPPPPEPEAAPEEAEDGLLSNP
jgi:hypothetical protein